MSESVDEIHALLLGGRTEGVGFTPHRGRKCLRCEKTLTLRFMCPRCEHIERGARAEGLRYIAAQMDNGHYDDADERVALSYLSLRAIVRSLGSVETAIEERVNERRLLVRREAEARAREEAKLVEKCDGCGRRFKTVAGLRVHERTHRAGPR